MENLYKIELNDQQIRLYVEGLLNSARIIGNQLTTQNTALVLKTNIDVLTRINNELSKLDTIIDAMTVKNTALPIKDSELQ